MAAESGFAKGLAAVAGAKCDSQGGGGKQDFGTGDFYCLHSAHGTRLLYGNAKPTLWCCSVLEVTEVESVQMGLFQDFLEEMNPLCVPDIHRKGKCYRQRLHTIAVNFLRQMCSLFLSSCKTTTGINFSCV